MKLQELCNAKVILVEEKCSYCLTHSWDIRAFISFSSVLIQKVNVIA